MASRISFRRISYDLSHQNRDKFAGQGAAAVQAEIDKYNQKKGGA